MNTQKLRFGLVGVINTLIDIGIYWLLINLVGFGILASNFISTSAGVLCSYLLNRSFTFKLQTKKSIKELTLFLAITFFGLWVLHPIVIYLTSDVTSNLLAWLPDYLVTLAPKCIAVGVSLVWNYVWYSRVIFKKHNTGSVNNDKEA